MPMTLDKLIMNIIGEINCNVNIDGSNPSPQNSSIIGLAMKSSPINIGRLSPIAKLIVLLANLVNSFFSPVIIRFENLGNKTLPIDATIAKTALVNRVAAV